MPDKFTSKLVPPEKLPEFMQVARDRYSYAVAIDAEDKKLALDDAEFCLAEPRSTGGTTQWDQGAAQQRIKLRRPCLTENRLQTFTAQVVNDGRQSKPAIRITPLDGGTKETADYFQGRIRHIEYDCNADIAYDTAREQQVTCGRGFLRVTWGYEWKSFRRRIKLERIDNQFAVVFGPAREYDCSDAEYCFVINAITKDEHKRKYGEETTAARTDFASSSNPAPGWFGVGTNCEMVQEAEYWEKTFKTRKLILLSTGHVCWKDEIPNNLAVLGVRIQDERDEQDYRVVQYIIDGADILGETEFPGPYIPIVPQWGREYFLDGRRRTLSLIRYAKDPQRLLNLYVSNIAEQISMMPKTPYWVAMGSIPSGLEGVYETLNDEPRAYVPYNQYDPNNPMRALNAPHRETAEPPIQALVAGYLQAVDAIKASMGIYDASLGNRSNEVSRVAINARQQQADNANYHFHDNEARTRNHVGRIMLHLIKEMDKGVGERPVRSEDGKTRMVKVNTQWRDPELKRVVNYDVENGDYGVAVSTGPSFTSQRQEAFVTYSEIAKTDRNFMGVAGDIVFRNMDAPGADQIADRLEKLLPEEIRPQKQGDDGQPGISPQVAAKVQMIQAEAGRVIEGLTQRVQELEQEIESRTVEVEGKKYTVQLQEETKRLIAAANLGQKEGLQLLLSELQAVKHRLDLQDAEAARQHQAKQAEANRTTQQAEAERQRQHQVSLAQQQAAAEAAGAATQPESPGTAQTINPTSEAPQGAPIQAER